MQTEIRPGDKVKCINAKPFPDKEVGPPLIEGEEYTVKGVVTTVGKHDHLDVGLASKYNYINCQSTGVQIPDGDKIHWCHPSRFTRI